MRQSKFMRDVKILNNLDSFPLGMLVGRHMRQYMFRRDV